jgi:hypothetical protein
MTRHELVALVMAIVAVGLIAWMNSGTVFP